MARYWTLVERIANTWGEQFGDYDKDVVTSERDDMVEGGAPRHSLKIIATTDHQDAIDAAIAKLNAKEAK